MAETEKVTINMNLVDLGKVDLLVEEGFYSNRTDFIKTAIRNQLNSHGKEIEKIINERAYVLGISKYDRKILENAVQNRKQLDIYVIGMLVIKDDVDLELAKRAISSIKVNGVFKAPVGIKEYFMN